MQPRISIQTAALMALTSLSLHSAVLADSTADFSTTQGAKNWYYGYFSSGNVNSFTQLPFYYTPFNAWTHTTCCPPWTSVGMYSVMSPNGTDSGTEEWAVREWISNYTGSVVVSGSIYKSDTNPASTGIYGEIYLNHIRIWTQYIAGTDGTGATYSLPLTLAAGDVLDFVVAPNGVDYNDSTILYAKVTSVYDPVTVDFSAPLATVSAAGFLHAVTTTSPRTNDVTPLQPRLWRIPADLSLYQRVRLFAPNITIHLNLDVYGYPDSNYGGHGPPWVNFTDWETFVRNTAAPFRGESNIIFNLWNEADDIYFPPGPGYQEFWNGTIQQFYDTYYHAWKALVAELGAGVQVAGPTYAIYDHNRIQDFLEYCLASGCQVNSLAWHALNDYSDPTGAIAANVQDAMTSFVSNPRYAPLGISRIDINEIIGSEFWSQPAGTLQYFAAFEQSGATAAARTCGFDANSQCFDGTLNGLLTPNTFVPRSVWWAQKFYADGAASRVRSQTPAASDVVLASAATGSVPPQVLIGYADFQATNSNQGGSVQVQLSLLHASASAVTGVRVELIPDTGIASLAQPQWVEDVTLPLVSGEGTLTLPALSLGGVFRVTLLTPQTISFATPADRTLSTGPFTISPSADSGLAVTAVSNSPGVCTLAGSTVTPVSVGTCSITASQSGDATHTAASAITRTFRIIPILQSIAVAPANSSLAQGLTQQFTATGTYSDNSTQDLTNQVTWTSSTSSATITAAGVATAVSAGASSIGATLGIAGSTTLTVTPFSPCDIDRNAVTNVSDVQRIINEALGVSLLVNDLNADGTVNVADVQIVINAALGLGCNAK